MIKIEVGCAAWNHGDGYWVRVDVKPIEGDDGTATDAFVARFPKSRKVHRTTLSRPIDGTYLNGSETVPLVGVNDFKFVADGTTGAKNETALKRLRAFLADLAKMDDVEVVEVARFSNSVPLAEVLAAQEAIS